LRRIANRRVALSLALGLVAMLVAIAAVAGGARAQDVASGGVKTPAVGAHPTWQLLTTAAAPNVVFNCQNNVPPNGPCFVPSTIKTAYSIQPLLDQGFDGSGKTIVIIDAYGSSTLASDLARFDTIFGLPAPDFTQVAPFGIDPTDLANKIGWSAETTLDVEWAHAIAPGAKIRLVIAKSNNDSDIIDATQYALDNNVGDVLSQSYGEAEQCMNPALVARQHAIFEAMTAQKWTLFASSGDSGSDQPGCSPNDPAFQAASTPASDPNVTSVGGTTLTTTNGLVGTYGSETTWNDAFGAGGGGFSVVYGRPDFQAPIVKDSKMRAEPDVAYNASVLQGVIVAWAEEGLAPNAFFRIGGTSAGSPQWAALAAITDQLAGGRVGNINKTLYFLGKKDQGKYFHDITVGNIGAFSAAPGFDEASGWGSPIASAIVPAIAKPGNG
jgi:subtilase family serine protease